MRLIGILLLCGLACMACETLPSDGSKPSDGTSQSATAPALLEDMAPKTRGDRAETPFDSPKEIDVTLTQFLQDQAAAWNTGSVEKYMAFYWQSPFLRFASGDTVVRGWPQILTRYKKRYPDTKTMGRLSFKSIEIDQVSKNSAIVYGQWRLQRETDAPWGLFTLVIRKFGDEWKITSDTTTYGGST